MADANEDGGVDRDELAIIMSKNSGVTVPFTIVNMYFNNADANGDNKLDKTGQLPT